MATLHNWSSRDTKHGDYYYAAVLICGSAICLKLC